MWEIQEHRSKSVDVWWMLSPTQTPTQSKSAKITWPSVVQVPTTVLYMLCDIISGGKLWMLHIYLVVYLPLWKMMEFVSWDDDIPIHYGNIIHMFQTTKQNRIIHPRDNIKYQLGYHRIIRLSDIIVWISNWDIIGLLRGIPSGNVLQFAVENHTSF